LLHAETTHTIGEPGSGLGATANGIYVVATLHVTNKKHSTATMTDEIVTLTAAKKEYRVSSDAETGRRRQDIPDPRTHAGREPRWKGGVRCAAAGAA
jgi:hypothetical protein